MAGRRVRRRSDRERSGGERTGAHEVLPAAPPAHDRLTPAGLASLQRSAGNRAVVATLAVQRSVGPVPPVPHMGQYPYWWYAAPHLGGSWTGQCLDHRVSPQRPTALGEAIGLPPSYGLPVGHRHPVPLPYPGVLLLPPGESPSPLGTMATASGSATGTGGGGTIGAGPQVAAGSRTIRRYNRGSDVAALQSLLARELGEPLAADGDFGSRTEAALVRFQGGNGLTPDGIAGRMTWQALGVAGD
jgi:hypothetical protein